VKHYLSALFIVVMICISAEAKEVVFSFRGTVHELDGEFSFFSGQPFEITYSFEASTEDDNPNDPETGNYIGAIKSGTLAIFTGRGVFTWLVEPDGPYNSIEVKNLDSSDSYAASMSVSSTGDGTEIPASFTVELMAANTAVFSNDKMPSFLEITSFDNQRIVIFKFIGAKQYTYSTIGVVTSGDAKGRKN
jgi:hypothetical protein